MDKDGTCIELAIEGERLCKAGDCIRGVQYFEAAVHLGTADVPTLGAIYSQLGNAYFVLQDFEKALEYHRLDLNLMRAYGDRLGEAKASGNLGNTFKVLGRYEEALVCCHRHLDIARELNDMINEAKALYNLGNVCHAKGKQLGRSSNHDPGDYPAECMESLEKATEYYEENLELVRKLGDCVGLGKTCGNLGNTHYLQGNFSQAIRYHTERLSIAKEFGDIFAERRAYSNLGNAHMFLGEFHEAAELYGKALQIGRQLDDRALEAQACYSLGNTYTLLRDYDKAIEYHVMHLRIAQELKDCFGEGRACWSLGNAYKALGQPQKALLYAAQYLEISKEVGDENGQMTGQSMLVELRTILGSVDDVTIKRVNSYRETSERRIDDKMTGLLTKGRRSSMENLDLIKCTPNKATTEQKKISSNIRVKSSKSGKSSSLRSKDTKQKSSKKASNKSDNACSHSSIDLDDGFFDLLSKFQSRRIDDQRCCSSVLDFGSRTLSTPPDSDEEGIDKENDGYQANFPNADAFLDMVAGIQGSRMNDQRANIFPGLRNSQEFIAHFASSRRDASELDDQFFEMLMRCQGSRIEDQRSEMPMSYSSRTIPDEDFINLILRFQSNRLEEQRSELPPPKQIASKRPSFRRKTDKSDKQSR